MSQWFKEHSLGTVLLIIFLALLVGQSAVGYVHNNDELQTHSAPTISYAKYLTSGSFIEATFENWESEFLQMGAYVVLTIYLRQKGSAESKKLRGSETVDKKPKSSISPNAPWPVRRGGWILKVYEHSLSLAFLLLFLMSFLLHAYGGSLDACQQNQLHNESCISMVQFMGSADFWFQSLQNWQSEFLAVFSIVMLSVYLREKGSPQSKAVNVPNVQTGSD